jgi:ABC-type antimicrobial peptide transport system permease subunit
MTKPSQWSEHKGLAAAILHDRQARRKVLGNFAILMLLLLIVGVCGIDHWLSQSLWRFLIYWATCGALTVFVIMFALYDVLAVIREEREKH